MVCNYHFVYFISIVCEKKYMLFPFEQTNSEKENYKLQENNVIEKKKLE